MKSFDSLSGNCLCFGMAAMSACALLPCCKRCRMESRGSARRFWLSRPSARFDSVDSKWRRGILFNSGERLAISTCVALAPLYLGSFILLRNIQLRPPQIAKTGGDHWIIESGQFEISPNVPATSPTPTNHGSSDPASPDSGRAKNGHSRGRGRGRRSASINSIA